MFTSSGILGRGHRLQVAGGRPRGSGAAGRVLVGVHDR